MVPQTIDCNSLSCDVIIDNVNLVLWLYSRIQLLILPCWRFRDSK